jgi:hypothetical protein
MLYVALGAIIEPKLWAHRNQRPYSLIIIDLFAIEFAGELYFDWPPRRAKLWTYWTHRQHFSLVIVDFNFSSQ